MNKLLISGGGMAGAILAYKAKMLGLSFKWFISDTIPAASNVSYGLCCPVHFRNAVPIRGAEKLYDASSSFFKQFNADFYRELPVHHLVSEKQELIKWRLNSESTDLWKYSDGELRDDLKQFYNEKFLGAIRIHKSFVVDMPAFLAHIRDFCASHTANEKVETNKVQILDNDIDYQGENFNRLIFCEGVHAVPNPFFKAIPFNPCKGEVLEVRIEQFELTEILHNHISIVPLTSGNFLLGSNFEWDDLSFQVTEKAKNYLLEQLKMIIGYRDIEVISHKAGVRPTISDRKPVVGWHPQISPLGILNGFGTRGLLYGPMAAEMLLSSLTNGSIWDDWNVNRFKKRFKRLN